MFSWRGRGLGFPPNSTLAAVPRKRRARGGVGGQLRLGCSNLPGRCSARVSSAISDLETVPFYVVKAALLKRPRGLRPHYFLFMISVKEGSPCCCLSLAWVPWSIFPLCLEVAESSLTRWRGIGIHGGRILPCCWLQLGRLSFSSASTQKNKHGHIFYSSSVLRVDGRKCRLVTKIRGSVTAFAAMSLKIFYLSCTEPLAICNMLNRDFVSPFSLSLQQGKQVFCFSKWIHPCLWYIYRLCVRIIPTITV